MSVLLADAVVASGREPVDVLAGYQGFGLASLTAGLARRCSQGVARDPLPDEPAHAVVLGDKTGAVRKRFARDCYWVVLPPNA